MAVSGDTGQGRHGPESISIDERRMALTVTDAVMGLMRQLCESCAERQATIASGTERFVRDVGSDVARHISAAERQDRAVCEALDRLNVVLTAELKLRSAELEARVETTKQEHADRRSRWETMGKILSPVVLVYLLYVLGGLLGISGLPIPRLP